MDLSSRLRAIVRTGPAKLARELTYEPDTGGYEATMDFARVGAILGGRPAESAFGHCLVIDRRYEADRFHGAVRIGDCQVENSAGLDILDPTLYRGQTPPQGAGGLTPLAGDGGQTSAGRCRALGRTIFIDLETTGLSGGAGTVAFLVGCGYFDLGAFQVRQFLLTSYASERALLTTVAEFFEGADLIVTYNGKTFDVPMMETRWLFHRMQMPDFSSAGMPHFDMLHPARRLWKTREGADDGGCRLSTLERVLFGVKRVGDVPGAEIPARFFRFLRSGDPRPLEPVLEHNRLDLVSLAAVMARGVRLALDGHAACRDGAEALALGRVYERAGALDRAEECYRCATDAQAPDVRGEALYRLGLRYRRERRFAEAAAIWREVIALTEPRGVRSITSLGEARQFAAEALAIHHEHRARDLDCARDLALFALEEADARHAGGMRHRLERIDRKIAQKLERKTTQKIEGKIALTQQELATKRDAQLFSS